MIALDDHALQLQWDSSKIDKGFKDLERKFAKFGKMDIKTSVSPDMKRGGARGSASSISQGERDRGIANLDATTLKARQQIEALNKVGSKEARSKILALEAAVKRLKLAEDGLNKSTKTTDKSFIRYKKTLRDTKNQINSMSKSTNTLARKFNTTKFAADGLTASLKNLGRSWVSVFAIGAGIIKLKNVSAEMENIGVASLLASGNAKKSAEDLIFVGKLTERLGLRYKDTAKAFATFNVGAISGGVDPDVAKDVFIKISEGLASAGTNAESAKLAFLGFRQIISGTVVQAQEINQIVDQVPAFSAAAVQALDEMGIRSADHMDKTTKSFKDTIKTAGVDAKEFTKIVARILSDQGKTSGALAEFMQSITAEENRMVNSTNMAVESLANAGLKEVFKDVFGGLKNVIIAITPALIALGTAFGVLSHAIALPFKTLDAFGQLLGFDEGSGIQFAIRVLALLILYKLVPALTAMSARLTVGAKSAYAMGRGFLAMNKGASVATVGVNRLKFAVKGLMRAAWPLLLLEGVFRGLEFLNAKSQIQDIDKRGSIAASAPSKGTNITVQNMHIQQKSGESPEEFGRRIFSDMDSLTQSQAPIF
jgi:tape measure domain-containing protein